MQRFCLTLDLRNNPALIAEYVRHHKEVWPEIQQSIRDAGVLDMQIYLLENRLFMIMDTTDDFTQEAKAKLDAGNPKVIEWETLMGKFQQVDEGSDPVGRWRPMEKIFQLDS